jgi:hypothetical protein
MCAHKHQKLLLLLYIVIVIEQGRIFFIASLSISFEWKEREIMYIFEAIILQLNIKCSVLWLTF